MWNQYLGFEMIRRTCKLAADVRWPPSWDPVTTQVSGPTAVSAQTWLQHMWQLHWHFIIFHHRQDTCKDTVELSFSHWEFWYSALDNFRNEQQQRPNYLVFCDLEKGFDTVLFDGILGQASHHNKLITNVPKQGCLPAPALFTLQKWLKINK